METINYKGNSLNVEFTRDAEAGNYGTDGDVRYQQDGVINSQKVRVYWNTTPSFNENNSRYKELINLQSESGLDEDESDELCYLECFFSDNSKACDWCNADEITLEDGSEFFTASPLKITKKYYIISHEEVGCNNNGIEDVEVVIQASPGTTNMSGEDKIDGWLGTNCGGNGDATASYAHGEYNNLEDAEKYVSENFDVVESGAELEDDDDGIIKRFRTAEYVCYEAGDYFQDSFFGYFAEYCESANAVPINPENLHVLVNWFESQVDDEMDGIRLIVSGIESYVKENFSQIS